MHKRNAIVTVVALGTMLLSASMLGTASADAATTVAAPSPRPPSSCSAVYFDQGVDVFCDQAPGTYQVVAQCNDGSDFWSSVGTVTVANSAPSVALCRGELLAPARVVSYYVIE